jgi:mannose-6-phosphate isomerase-like protein (cupin superfamily)
MENKMKTFLFALTLALPLAAQSPLAERIAHADPSKYTHHPDVHNGAGPLDYMMLFDEHVLETNLYFLHRGVIEPHGGIGAHFHNNCEEMFVILDGEAQFTVDGRTALVKGPAGAPTRMGHSHAIYNPTDKPVQWMNINVSAVKGVYDAFNLDDPRTNVTVDKIPTFMTMHLDRALLRPVTGMNGGKGTVQYRRALDTSVFAGPWAYVDHFVVPPGASIGAHRHPYVAEVFYVMNGDGKAAIGTSPRADTADIHNGDAIPIRLNEVHSFENTGSQPLEFMVIGVATDSSHRVDTIDGSAPARGAAGGSGRGGGR